MGIRWAGRPRNRLAHVLSGQRLADTFPAGGLQSMQCLHRPPFVVRDDSGETSVAYHLQDAGHPGDGLDIRLLQSRAVARPAHDAGMQHPGKAHILQVGLPAADLGGYVDSRQILSDHPRAALVAWHIGLGGDMQGQSRDQFAVADGPAVRCVRGAVLHFDLVHREREAPGRCFGQQDAHVRGGVQDCRAAVLQGAAARGNALVGRTRGVGGDDIDRRRRDGQLVGGNLDQGRLEALSELGLAGEDRNQPIAADADPGI